MKRCRGLLILDLALMSIILGCTGGAGTGDATPDTTAPSIPTSLITIVISTGQINLTWTVSTDDVGVAGYKIYRDGVYLKSTSTIPTTDTGLNPSTNYCYQVSAYNAAGNESAKCTQVCAIPDATAPSVPTDLITTVISTSQINLIWTASTDDVGVAGYKIYRDGVYLKSTSTIPTTDTGLTHSTNYCYQVTAYDAAGNESAKCTQVCATTNNYRTYSFEGVISNLYYDGAGIIANKGYKIGDSVFAKFNVDFASDGYYILNNGEKLIPENTQTTNNPYWYFYAELIDGTLMPVMNGGFFNGPTDIKEYHIGYLNSGPVDNTGALQGGTGNSYFTILKESYTDASVQGWVIGEHLKGIIVAWSDKDWSIMWADMILTDIQIIP